MEEEKQEKEKKKREWFYLDTKEYTFVPQEWKIQKTTNLLECKVVYHYCKNKFTLECLCLLRVSYEYSTNEILNVSIFEEHNSMCLNTNSDSRYQLVSKITDLYNKRVRRPREILNWVKADHPDINIQKIYNILSRLKKPMVKEKPKSQVSI